MVKLNLIVMKVMSGHSTDCSCDCEMRCNRCAILGFGVAINFLHDLLVWAYVLKIALLERGKKTRNHFIPHSEFGG